VIKNKYLTTDHINVSIAIEEIAREFIRYGTKKMGIEERLDRFTAYIKKRETKCVEGDVISHYVDSIFLPILNNSEQLAIAIDKKVVPRYYRNRFTRALNTRDKAFIRWFLRNYVLNYTDVDAVVSNNYQLLPCFFGYCFNVCPIGGGTCASNATYTCLSLTELPQTMPCCTGSYFTGYGKVFDLVDNVPWVSSHSTGGFGINTQVPQSAGTFTLTGNVTGPSCFPSSGVTLNLDLIVSIASVGSGTCASSCPSGAPCVNTNVPYCPGSAYSVAYIPVLYYNVGLTVLPNSTYSVWWQASVS
jgi:hypothetical protein